MEEQEGAPSGGAEIKRALGSVLQKGEEHETYMNHAIDRVCGMASGRVREFSARQALAVDLYEKVVRKCVAEGMKEEQIKSDILVGEHGVDGGQAAKAASLLTARAGHIRYCL
jgi:hypothetical protein